MLQSLECVVVMIVVVVKVVVKVVVVMACKGQLEVQQAALV